MYLLPVVFVLALLFTVLFSLKKISPPATFLPNTKDIPAPTVFPSPAVVPTSSLSEIENDLKNIKGDIDKVKKPDARFNPPEFIFDLGI